MKRNNPDLPFIVDVAEGTIYFNGMSNDCVEYIMDRFDNYYDANGLTGYDIHTGTPDRFSVDFYWNSVMKLPDDGEIIENLMRWFGEYLYRITGGGDDQEV